MTSVERLEKFKVYIRDRTGFRAGQVDDFLSLKATLLFNDVGTWTLTISRGSTKLVPLTTPGFDLEIYDHGSNQTFMRGPINTREQKYDASTDSLTITGWDDNQWLKWRLAHPSPAEVSPPYTTQAYDVRTGQASAVLAQYANVNLGPTAIGPRRLTSVTSLDGAVGATVTGRARWQVLLPFLQDLALQGGSNVGFTIARDVSTGQMQFVTYGTTDRTTTVKFSVALGNLVGGTIKSTSPNATYVFSAGSGDLTARVYHESYDPDAQATWGRREYFLDSNSTSVDAELQASAEQALVDQGEQAEFAIQITDTASVEYGIDYNLGDKVTATFIGSEPAPIVVGNGVGKVQEVVRQVDLELSNTDLTLKPTIGTPTRQEIFRIFREIRRLRQQLQNRTNN
jgi:hypothetical protein